MAAMQGLIGRRRMLASAVWSDRIAWFALVLLVTAALAHRYGLLETLPFFWVMAIVGMAALLAVGLAARSFARFWSNGDRIGASAAKGLFFGVLALSPFIVMTCLVYVYPRLADVSTDPTTPPALEWATAHRDGSMNGIVAPDGAQIELQADAYPSLIGRRYAMPSDTVLVSIRALIASRGWKVVAQSPTAVEGGQTIIEAVAGSLILNVPVDVSIRVEDEGLDSSYVDMRSSSRYGQHDLGDNARRIVGFMRELDALVAAQAGLAPEPAD